MEISALCRTNLIKVNELSNIVRNNRRRLKKDIFMTSENGKDPLLNKKLDAFKASPNWGEQTGPFFHLQLPGEAPIGPFHGVQLKNFFEENGLPAGTNVRDAKGIVDWQEIYQHLFFQRRTPQLLSSEEFPSEIESAYILVEGQKSDPYSAKQLNDLIDTQEILLTDQVSFDNGASWRKLYEYEEFDRRDHEQAELPESPGWDIFKESNTEIESELKTPTEAKQEEEAIAGLAFLENLKSGKTAKAYDKLTKEEALSDELPPDIPAEMIQNNIDPTKSGKPKTWAYALAICLMLTGSAYFLTTSKDSGKRAASSARNTPNAPNLEPASRFPGKKASNRLGKKANAYKSPRLRPKTNPRTRRPASITTTDSFKGNNRRRMQDDPYENSQEERDTYEDEYKEEYDYDRGETPVQQDPIRTRLDKQTIDSEKDYYDDNQQETLEAAYDSDLTEDAPQIDPADVWDTREPANFEDEISEDDLKYDE